VTQKSNSAVFLLLLGVAVVISLGGLYLLGEKSKSKDDSEATAAKIARPEAPANPVTGAFAAGGRPQTSGPARVVFKDAIPDFVIALDAWGRTAGPASDTSDLDAARAAVVGALRKAELDPIVLPAFEAVIDASIEAAKVPDAELDAAADALMSATLTLNDAIATAGLGFFIDADVQSYSNGRRSVLLFSFEVERVVLYRSGGHDVRTLRIRRLDNLNFVYNLLGFTSPKRRDAVVLDNKVDEHLLGLLPAISQDIRMDPFHLGEKDTHTAWFNPLRKLATAIIRDELGSAGNEDLQTLGELLARRHEIYLEWNELLEARRMKIDPPTSLTIEWQYRRQMAGLVTHAAMDELDAIQDKLSKPAMQKAYRDAHELFAQSVERHEAQHRLDLAELYTLPMPAALAEYVGELPGGFRGQGDLASSSLAEMSAYLSELSRDPLTPKLNLTILVGYLLNTQAWGMGESYAALVILGGLADKLSIEHSELVVGRRIDRDAVAQIYQKMVEVETEQLQRAAARLWEEYFELELPQLELIAR
jgi:hypothetical protein